MIVNTVAQPESAPLGGHAADLVGKLVAFVPVSTYVQRSKFADGDEQTVLRARVFGPGTSGPASDLGIHLIWWAGVQRTIAAATYLGQPRADAVVGILEHIPQQSDPSRTVYTLRVVTEGDRFEALTEGLRAVELSAEDRLQAEKLGVSETAPF